MKKIPVKSGLVAATVLNAKIYEVEKKIQNTSISVTTTFLNTKISEFENKVPDSSKYVTSYEFNKLTAESFEPRLKQADLVNKTDFNNELTSFGKQMTSNKTKHLEVLKKLNSLVTKDYNFSLGSIDVFYQPALATLELKNDKSTDYVLSLK